MKKEAPVAAKDDEPRPVYGDRVSVRGIPREASKEDIAKFFSTFGEVKRCRIARGMTTVEFTTNEAATKALEAHDKPYTGSEINLRVKLTTRRGPRRAAVAAKKVTTTTNADNKSRRVTVTLEPTGASADAVQGIFSSAGEIVTFTANENGSFTIAYTTSEAADAAIAKSGSKLSNAVLTVKAAPSRKRTTDRRRRNRKDKNANKPAATTSNVASPSKKETGAAKKRTAEPAVDLSNYVYVGGLAEGADDASVRKLLSSFGKITNVNVTSKTYKDGVKKTFATVHFEAAASAEKAIANGASKVAGLVVEKAVRLPKATA